MTEPIKVLSAQQVEDCCCNFSEVANYVFKDTLRQVVEMLDGMENPYIVILDVLNTKTMIQKAKSEGYDEAIQTIKQPLQQAIGEGAG